MKDTKFVKPAPGLKVRNPETGLHLPDEGDQVPLTTYWRRRLKDGDVVDAKPAKSAKPAGNN